MNETDRRISRNSIRALATAKTFERGEEYYKSGAVISLVKRGARVSAKVEGSDYAPYTVAVELADGGVASASCTCPYDFDGYCKHIVATLLKLASEPGVIAERPPVASLLGELDRGGLVALIEKRAAVDPGLANWLEVEIGTRPPSGAPPGAAGKRRTPVDSEPIREAARALIGRRGHGSRRWDDDDDETVADAEGLQDLIAKAAPFLAAGDGRNALRVLEPIANVVAEQFDPSTEEIDDDLIALLNDLDESMAEAALMAELPQPEREALAATIEDIQSEFADIGLEDAFPLSSLAAEADWNDPALKAVLAGRAETWPPPGAEHGSYDVLIDVRLKALAALGRDADYLRLARAARAHTSYAAMLVKLDRAPEALDYAVQQFRAPSEALNLAEALRAAGRHDDALRIAERGLGLGGEDENEFKFSVIGLARWLADYAGSRGRTDLALAAARAAFAATGSLADYRAAVAWAGENWPAVRQEFLALLETARRADDRTEIYLSEGMIDAAVRSADADKDLQWRDELLMRLAKVAHASHSPWVIQLAERKAAHIINANDSQRYELAARWLEHALAAHDAAGTIDEWAETIEGLIEKHRRKHKLRPLLEALRLGGRGKQTR